VQQKFFSKLKTYGIALFVIQEIIFAKKLGLKTYELR
jgi:hypothetical protein